MTFTEMYGTGTDPGTDQFPISPRTEGIDSAPQTDEKPLNIQGYTNTNLDSKRSPDRYADRHGTKARHATKVLKED